MGVETKIYNHGYNDGCDETVETMCKCYCDDICEKGMSGMCWYKHDHLQQVKSSFKYCECNNLQMLRNSVNTDTFKWDYENWCPIKEEKAMPLF